MRTIFMGTPAYALGALEVLAKKTKLVAVFSRPDAASRRGSTLIPSPVSRRAEELAIDLYKPKTLRNDEVIQQIRDLKPELIIVAAYGMILPKEVLEIPPMGCLNLHASILPRWRGAAPIQRAILSGDKETGVALMQMEEGLDTGAYSYVATTEVGQKTTEELSEELGALGAAILAQYLDAVGEVVWCSQDESQVTYAHKICDEDVALMPEDSAITISRKVRASSDSAPAILSISDSAGDEYRVRVLKVNSYSLADSPYREQLEKVNSTNNVFITKKNVLIKAQDNWLELDLIKPDGKREMRAIDFARGARLKGELSWH